MRCTHSHALSRVALNAERLAAWLALTLAFKRAIMAATSSSRAASTAAGGGVAARAAGGGGVGLRGFRTGSGKAMCGARGVGVIDPGRGMVYGIGETARCGSGLLDRLDASFTARMKTDTSAATSGISGPLGAGDRDGAALPVRGAAGVATLAVDANAADARARASAAAAALAGLRAGGPAGDATCCGSATGIGRGIAGCTAGGIGALFASAGLSPTAGCRSSSPTCASANANTALFISAALLLLAAAPPNAVSFTAGTARDA
jgi:hypothetical protein